MAISQDTINKILVAIGILTGAVIIYAFFIFKELRKAKQDRQQGWLQDEDISDSTRPAHGGLTHEDAIVPVLPPVYRHRERARHGVYPRPPGWRPQTLRPTRPRPFHTYVEADNTASHIVRDLPLPAHPHGVVAGGHRSCAITISVGDGDHFVSSGIASSTSLPSYRRHDPEELPPYEHVADGAEAEAGELHQRMPAGPNDDDGDGPSRLTERERLELIWAGARPRNVL